MHTCACSRGRGGTGICGSQGTSQGQAQRVRARLHAASRSPPLRGRCSGPSPCTHASTRGARCALAKKVRRRCGEGGTCSIRRRPRHARAFACASPRCMTAGCTPARHAFVLCCTHVLPPAPALELLWFCACIAPRPPLPQGFGPVPKPRASCVCATVRPCCIARQAA